MKLHTLLILPLSLGLILASCQRSQAMPETSESRTAFEEKASQEALSDIQEATVANEESSSPVPVRSREVLIEDPDRLWLPPTDVFLDDVTVPLAEITTYVEERRLAAHSAQLADDLKVIEEARQGLAEAQLAIYGLAVRMRPLWTQMEYQAFLSSQNFAELLGLAESLSRRQAYLSRQAYLWSSSAASIVDE